MIKKRRKSEELNCGKRASSSKDKQVELSSKSSIPSVLSDNMASYPFSMPSTSSSKHITCEDLSRHAINLLEQNVRAFSQIRANLSSYKVEDNIDLFHQARNNLITIQNDMNEMSGLMSQMPPLPVTINDDLSVSMDSDTAFVMLASACAITTAITTCAFCFFFISRILAEKNEQVNHSLSSNPSSPDHIVNLEELSSEGATAFSSVEATCSSPESTTWCEEPGQHPLTSCYIRDADRALSRARDNAQYEAEAEAEANTSDYMIAEDGANAHAHAQAQAQGDVRIPLILVSKIETSGTKMKHEDSLTLLECYQSFVHG